MRKILDKMFANKKLSLFVPMLFSTLLYLLFLAFGTAEDKINTVIAIPIACVFWFFGSFFVVYIQVKNPSCPEGFLNFVELFATAFFCLCSAVSALLFVISGFQDFNPVMCLGFITYSSISWAHSKRVR